MLLGDGHELILPWLDVEKGKCNGPFAQHDVAEGLDPQVIWL